MTHTGPGRRNAIPSNVDSTPTAWQKSSYSTNGGNCVELACTGDHYLV
ncbi:DUF397 domain-containing protein, partial [Streptomyces anulatus]